MPPTLDRSILESALELYEGLGKAFVELQIYGESHPRFGTTLEHVQGLISKFFQTRPTYVSIVFGISDQGVEFQRIPLPGLQAHGERLRKALRELSVSMLQVEPGVATGDVSRLASALRKRVREPGSFKRENGSEDRVGPFRLISDDEARELAEAQQTDGMSGADDKAALGDLPELLVSETALAAVMASYRDVLSSTEQGDSSIIFWCLR